METEEIWKDVPGWEGLYIVSNIGNVKGLERKVWNGVGFFDLMPKTFSHYPDRRGYIKAQFTRNFTTRTYGIHQLVAMAFLGHDPEGCMVVDHINGVPYDNRVENLRIVSHRFNVCVGYRKTDTTRKHQYMGISQASSGRWVARITINRKTKHIGTFDTDKEAGEAYQKALAVALAND